MFGTEIATSTITASIGSLFTTTINSVIYVIGYIWPYILVIAAFAYFIRVVRSGWRAH